MITKLPFLLAILGSSVVNLLALLQHDLRIVCSIFTMADNPLRQEVKPQISRPSDGTVNCGPFSTGIVNDSLSNCTTATLKKIRSINFFVPIMTLNSYRQHIKNLPTNERVVAKHTNLTLGLKKRRELAL